MYLKSYLFFISFLTPKTIPDSRRIKFLTWLFVLIYSTTLFGLFLMWYDLLGISTFHCFDDRAEWLQMDKYGHFYASFVICSSLYRCWRWAGLSVKKSILLASILAFLSQTSYEFFDGLSVGYGASISDIVANLIGVLAVSVQILAMTKIIAWVKLSFHQTALAAMRPDFFGSTLPQNFLKDYNGQTYWVTFSINKVLKIRCLPDWIQLAIGLGAEGMLGGDDNIWTDKSGNLKDYSSLLRSRKFVVSLDIHPAYFKNKIAKNVFWIFEYIKFPFPAFGFVTDVGFKFWWIYF